MARPKMPVLYRTMHLEQPPTRAEGESELPALAISSEYAVHRHGWFGEHWVEVLDHGPEAVVLAERAGRGLSLLLNHTSREHVGRVKELELGQDRVLRGRPMFSRSALGKEVEQDVLDGIRSDVSVGYRVHEMVLEKQDKDAGIDYYRVTKWEPLEVSLVAVPADPTVGVGRSEQEDGYPVLVRGLPPEEPAMDAKPEVPAVAGGSEPSREAEIKGLAALAKMHNQPERFVKWIEEGTTLAAAKDELLAELGRGAQPKVAPPDAGSGVQLTEKEAREYSLSKAILALADGTVHTLGLEREVSEEIEKRARDPEVNQPRHGGANRLYVPSTLPIFAVQRSLQERFAHYFQRGALEVATASKGGELKFIEPGPFIELLRNRMLVRALGARVLTGLRGDISFPRQITAAAASWVPESPTADVGSTNLTLDSPDLAPRILQATTSYTRKLLAQGVVDVDMLVRDDFVQVHALAIDLASITGLGTSNQPTGILNTSGIGSVTIGANGGVPTYDHFVDLETEVAVDNADLGALAYLSTARVRGRMKKSAAISATTGVPAWFNNEVNGYNAQASQQVPANLTKGTSTTICHAIIFGNWAELLIGYWGDLELIVDPYSAKKRGDVEVTTYQMCDVTLRHAESFAAVKDALP